MALQSEAIKVIVNSRKVLAGIAEYDVPVYNFFGQAHPIKKRVLLYERVFQEDENSLLEEAKTLAALNRVPLQIVDLGKRNFISRWIFRFFSRIANPPSLIFSGGPLLSLEKESLPNLLLEARTPVGARAIGEALTVCC